MAQIVSRAGTGSWEALVGGMEVSLNRGNQFPSYHLENLGSEQTAWAPCSSGKRHCGFKKSHSKLKKRASFESLSKVFHQKNAKEWVQFALNYFNPNCCVGSKWVLGLQVAGADFVSGGWFLLHSQSLPLIHIQAQRLQRWCFSCRCASHVLCQRCTIIFWEHREMRL